MVNFGYLETVQTITNHASLMSQADQCILIRDFTCVRIGYTLGQKKVDYFSPVNLSFDTVFKFSLIKIGILTCKCSFSTTLLFHLTTDLNYV